ncbi:universal stress protein [Oxyplasma meridianum]|uniref:Universal stress protein n=1 Tax=Oxyplasma meridianum TaxID=3073602 RepID=A0AAX4NEU6_9ARCH
MKIMVAFDGTNSSINALNYALDLKNSSDGYLIIYSISENKVIPPYFGEYSGDFYNEMVEKDKETAESVMDMAMQIAKKHAVTPDVEIVDMPDVDTADTILKTAYKFKADMIVMGMRRLGRVEKFILGSVSAKVIERSKIPVLVAPPKTEETEKK